MYTLHVHVHVVHTAYKCIKCMYISMMWTHAGPHKLPVSYYYVDTPLPSVVSAFHQSTSPIRTQFTDSPCKSLLDVLANVHDDHVQSISVYMYHMEHCHVPYSIGGETTGTHNDSSSLPLWVTIMVGLAPLCPTPSHNNPPPPMSTICLRCNLIQTIQLNSLPKSFLLPSSILFQSGHMLYTWKGEAHAVQHVHVDIYVVMVLWSQLFRILFLYQMVLIFHMLKFKST